ncbi:protein BatD [bacterium]|nr:protein BatD [bacterium]
MRRFGIAILSLSIWAASALSADWSVSSDIDRARIGIDDNLTLTITVTGDKLSGFSGPQFTENHDWALTNTSTSTSSNFQLINGRMSQSKTITTYLYLAPKHKGTLTVPRISVSANGEKKSSKSFQVEVVDGSVASAQPRGRSRTYQPRSTQAAPAPSPSDIKDKLFLSAHADKREAYVGEQINVTFTLYTQYSLGEISMSKDAVFNGFWEKELYRAKSLQYQRKTINGKQYNAVVLAKHAIFALSSGEKTIEPMELDCSVMTRRDFWGVFSHGEKVKVVGRPLKIKIKPLPPGAPAGFDGLVGDFSVSSKISSNDLKTNEAFSYIITVSGTGNLHILDTPELQFPPGFELFDSQKKENIKTDGGRVSGSVRFEYILVPRSEGDFDLPQWRLSFFDPKSKRYKTAATKPYPVTIAKGQAEKSGGMKVISRGEVVRVGEDIRFIAPDCNRLSTGHLAMGDLRIFLYLLPAEAVLLLIGLLIRRRKERLEGNIGYARYTRAMRKAMSELRAAEARIDDSEAFVAATQNAILHYLADRLGLPREGMVFSDVRDGLAERRIDDETLDGIEELIERLNFLRFAPGEKGAVSKELLEDAKGLIRKVDRAFK